MSNRYAKDVNNPFSLDNAYLTLKRTVERFAKEYNFNIFEHYIKRAKKDNKVLTSLIKKFVADKEHQEIVITDNRPLEKMTTEQLKRYLDDEVDLVDGHMVEKKAV